MIGKMGRTHFVSRTISACDASPAAVPHPQTVPQISYSVPLVKGLSLRTPRISKPQSASIERSKTTGEVPGLEFTLADGVPRAADAIR